jgi:hypothetical protein
MDINRESSTSNHLALASLTGGDRSIGIVRWRTKTTEFYEVLFLFLVQSPWNLSQLQPDSPYLAAAQITAENAVLLQNTQKTQVT